MTRSREIRLVSRPRGMPSLGDFQLTTVDTPDPAPGEVLVRNLWMSVDPYMRGRMNDAKSYVPPFELGKAMEGGAVGRVEASRDPALKQGDLVLSNFGWREAFTASAKAVQKLEPGPLPPQAFLGLAGMPGLTAYVGLLRIAGLKLGDVVFVSGAAGAVGSMVCQIAKAKGHTVIGSAGGPEKVAFLEDIGVDHAIDYKAAPNLASTVLACAPDGIDVYFDNVGGEHLEAALTAARRDARFAICGMISMYNAAEPPPGPRNLALMIGKAIRMQGFIVSYHFDARADFIRDLSGWMAEGKIKSRETVLDGLEHAPEAFLGLFTGRNIGKMLVKLA